MGIKTLSIPNWMEEFLKENPDLSPSKMLQSKIIEIHERRKINFSEVRNLRNKINFLQGEVGRLGNELAKKEKS